MFITAGRWDENSRDVEDFGIVWPVTFIIKKINFREKIDEFYLLQANFTKVSIMFWDPKNISIQ